MNDTGWLMRIESGLSAHFKLADGSSRPGTMWTVGLKRGDEMHTAMVKALLTPEASAATRKDTQYQAQTAMRYLNDLIAQGWNPRDTREHTIHIGNPLGARAKKRWWQVW